ncbi:Sodium channel protein Nach [Eumeta japonica]|uniref:Sodium channel protein Nach n=1 Tax=Eumeta variegata TaxID=151549 RepID=A0A4C1W2U7_EUMVA|nr:Sodium channel protein Nach [Eumeta japonica]
MLLRNKLQQLTSFDTEQRAMIAKKPIFGERHGTGSSRNSHSTHPRDALAPYAFPISYFVLPRETNSGSGHIDSCYSYINHRAQKLLLEPSALFYKEKVVRSIVWAMRVSPIAKPRHNNLDDGGSFSLLATSLRHQTTEFFNNSTLHGVRYIAEKDRPFCEKFMWFSFTAVGAVATCIIIVSLWEKFQTNPTITGLDTDFHNWDVPFPAVTICDMEPVDEELIQEYIEKTWGSSAPTDAASMLRWLTTLSYHSIAEHVHKFINDQDLMDEKRIPNTKDAVFSIVSHCESLFYDCEWKGESEECCDVMVPVFTEMGFCYAFNSKHAERAWPWQSQSQSEQFNEAFIHETDAKWSFVYNSYRNETVMDVSMKKDTDLKIGPTVRNVTAQSVHGGGLCRVCLTYRQKRESNGNDGVMTVYIHSTEEMAGLELSPQHSWDRRVEKVAFSVKHTYTTEDARQLSVRQRRCVFPDEHRLETSPYYTYSACMRQCRMRLSRSFCDCVPHFYPPIEGYRQCMLRELACIARHVQAITDVTRCDCELGCTHTVYEVEKLTEFDATKTAGGGLPTSLETEFVSWPMVRYKREVLFGWVDLLVSFGGIAGLFLGFSLLSGVEMIYYFTLRAWCAAVRDADTLRRERAERRARPKPPHDLSLVPWWRRPPVPRSSRPLVVRERDRPPKYSPPPGYTVFLP